MKRLALVALLALVLATASSTMAAPPAQEPESVACGDYIVCSTTGDAVYVQNTNTGASIVGHNTTTGYGVKGRGNPGVIGSSYHSAGVRGISRNNMGVKAESVNGYGLMAQSTNSHAIYVPGAGANGVDVVSAGGDGVKVYSAGHNGVQVASANWSGVYVNSSGTDAIRVQTAGNDGLRMFEGIGGDYIYFGSGSDPDFRVLNNGEARSDIGFNTPAADFAEMMDVEGAKTDYEPGDVLVVSDAQDRAVELSSASYSQAVIGVYSTKPGFVGGQPVSDNEQTPDIPVAIVGIVPCKVSAENGAIGRGDLLVTSSTPGHAMRASGPPPGTILGKALETLDKGTGVILVLVTLQ